MNKIILENLTIKFKEIVLDSISYTFEDTNYIIQGKNGSGKTSLIRAITNFCPIHKGDIKKDCTVSYFPSDVLLFNYLSAREFIKLVNKSINEDILMLLEVNYLDTYIHKMSMGQVNKLLLYLTLSSEADYYIIDELINAVDIEVKNRVLKYLLDLKDSYFILISHDENLLQSLKQSDNVTMINIESKKIYSKGGA